MNMPGWLLRAILIATGGGIGALLRTWINLVGNRHFANVNWPLSTLFANALGCFLIGVLHITLSARFSDRPELRSLLIVGFLGALTTFSSYGLETAMLAENRRLFAAASYVLLSNAVGIAFVFVGLRLARSAF